MADALLWAFLAGWLTITVCQSSCASAAFHWAARSQMVAVMLVEERECDFCLFLVRGGLRIHLANMKRCRCVFLERCSFSDIAQPHKSVLRACDVSIRARLGICSSVGVPARNTSLALGSPVVRFPAGWLAGCCSDTL